MTETEELRATIASLSPTKTTRRYDEPLKRRIVTHARERLACGDSVATIALALDMGQPTLVRFLDEVPSIVPVRLVPPKEEPSTHASHGIVVHAPGGITIEGLELNDVAALVQRLTSCSA